MKCNDCGSKNYVQSDFGRGDVCIKCFELRGQLLDAVKVGSVCMDEFRELQKVLGSRNGKAASAIRRTLGLTAPEI